MRRRASVSGQGGRDPTKAVLVDFAPKVAKSDEAVEKIRACIKKNVLFSQLSPEYTDAVIASMKEVGVTSGDKLIKQGELGDNWYVVETGAFEVWKKVGEEEPKKVNSYVPGDSFGELALMYNQRRAASVVATADSTVWAVDQDTFRTFILAAAMANSPAPDIDAKQQEGETSSPPASRMASPADTRQKASRTPAGTEREESMAAKSSRRRLERQKQREQQRANSPTKERALQEFDRA